MMRNALILCAGFLVAICLGCGSAKATQICDGSTAQSFLMAVYVLPPGYDPQENGNKYDPPTNYAIQFQPANNSAITSDLTAAFNYAPDFFKNNLCNLSGIYITTGDCSNGNAYNCSAPDAITDGSEVFDDAWGFRSRSHKDLGNKYIAISAALWPQAGSARPLSEYETVLTGYNYKFSSFGGPLVNLPLTIPGYSDNPDVPHDLVTNNRPPK